MKTTFTAILSLALSCLCNNTIADTFGSGPNQFELEFVTIGNPGNMADTTGKPNPAGAVDYVYLMGKYEISREMVTKANTVGDLEITLDEWINYAFEPRPEHAGNRSELERGRTICELAKCKPRIPVGLQIQPRTWRGWLRFKCVR